MTKASDNPFPYMRYVEQGSTPSNPAAGSQRLFVRSSDHILCMVDSSGTVTALSGSLTNPMTTQDDVIIGGASGVPARLAKGNAGGVLAMGNGHVIWNAGTSFPGSKATNDRYWRTDLGQEFFWDGTRWLSSVLHALDIGGYNNTDVQPLAAAGGAKNLHRQVVPSDVMDMWIVDARMTTRVAATNDGTHFWTVNIRRSDGTSIYAPTTAADTAAVITRHAASVGALMGTAITYVDTLATPTSTPGNLDIVMVQLTFRFVGT